MPFVISKKNPVQKQCLEKTTKRRKKNAGAVLVKTAAANSLPNDLLPDIKIVWRPVGELKPTKRRVRKTTPEQLAGTIRTIRNFTFVSPITIRGDVVIDGYIRVLAAKELGLTKVPCVDISHLSESQARMLAISLNRLGETGTWDFPELKLELIDLEIAGFDLTLSNFSVQQLDIIMLDEADDTKEDEEAIPEVPSQPVSRLGDLWFMGKHHRLLCGNALDSSSYALLLSGTTVAAVLTDPPYNVKIAGNVSGLGQKTHGEFQMASGEMSVGEFHDFLRIMHKHCYDHLMPGGVMYSFMDWRSIDVLMAAGREAGLQLLNMPVWYKGTGSMGAFLRSAHELICLFCKGDKPRVNNVELGKHGRDRTNVWVYPGANQPGSSAAEMLKDHPTPKNLEMCVDAILDVTHKGEAVLDPFLGSGTTLIAAEKSGRACFGIELDAGYADVCIRRWEQVAGQQAVHAATGLSFNDIAAERTKAG